MFQNSFEVTARPRGELDRLGICVGRRDVPKKGAREAEP
jgi:hypothetical protein